MKEAPVEERLKTKLEAEGFQVLKLTCPGYAGVMDRMILAPVWAIKMRPLGTALGPWFVECKRPGANLRRLQELVAENFKARGVRVLDFCDTYERVDEIVLELLSECGKDTPCAL